MFLHRGESRHLARMLHLKKELEHFDKYSSARVKAARISFAEFGFKTIRQRLAKQIFDFSSRIVCPSSAFFVKGRCARHSPSDAMNGGTEQRVREIAGIPGTSAVILQFVRETCSLIWV